MIRNNDIINSGIARNYGMSIEEFVNMPLCYQQELWKNFLRKKINVLLKNDLKTYLSMIINQEMLKKERIKSLIKR